MTSANVLCHSSMHLAIQLDSHLVTVWSNQPTNQTVMSEQKAPTKHATSITEGSSMLDCSPTSRQHLQPQLQTAHLHQLLLIG